MTALRPQLLSARSVAVGLESATCMKVRSPKPETVLYVGGQESCVLTAGESLKLRRVRAEIRLLQSPDDSIAVTLPLQLNWNGLDCGLPV